MKDFKTKEALARGTAFLDYFARRGWEPFHNNIPPFLSTTSSNQAYYNRNKEYVHSLKDVITGSTNSLISALGQESDKLETTGEVNKPPFGIDVSTLNNGFDQFERKQLFELVTSNGISSVSDATVKATSFMKVIADSFNYGNKRYLFRGQSNINYPLVPSLGRMIKKEIKDGELTEPCAYNNVLDLEMDMLNNFKNNWKSYIQDDLDEYIVNKYAEDDLSWWVLMQHYANSNDLGTRLLDVSSSLLFALLFACVSWSNGIVNEEVDGILYLFIEGQNSAVLDYDFDHLPTSSNIFNVTPNFPPHVPTMIINPPHNERSKAQQGGFIWWPKFWEPLQNHIQYLRIPKEHKLSIAKELLSFNIGPMQAVRGDKGRTNQQNLIKQIKQMN